MRWLARVIWPLIGGYGLAVSGFLLLRLGLGEPTPIALVNRFLPLILMPALLLLPVCLLRRRVRLALLLIPAVWMFGRSYAPLFLPNPDPPDAPRLTLATYNLGARTTQLDALACVIRAVDADLIGLQEVSPEAAEVFARELADVYPYQALHPHETAFFGTGILSQYPLMDEAAYPIDPGRLRLLRVQVDFEGTPVTVFDFHAQPVTESWRPPDVLVRRNQVLRLLDEAEVVAGPRILLGDFNLNDQSEDYQLLTAGYRDAFYEAGWGMGFTNPVWGDLEAPPISRRLLDWVPPHRRIDFVFYDANFQAATAQVWPDSDGSDHLLLRAELALVDPGAAAILSWDSDGETSIACGSVLCYNSQ